MTNIEKTYSGFIAIIGRPNVGKSTLLNYLVGQKVSITADKPQTTRHRVLGVKTVGNKQAIFVDTPGIQTQYVKRQMNKSMNVIACRALFDVERILFVVEGTHWGDKDQYVLDLLKKVTCPVDLVINKTDQVHPKSELLTCIAKYKEWFNFSNIIPIAAQKGAQVEVLQDIIFNNLPEGPHFFDADQSTDQAKEFRASEIIREKLVRFLGEEMPFSVAVNVTDFNREERGADRADLVKIRAQIWVERDSQKAIVIGKGGHLLQKIGMRARYDLEKWLQCKVFLDLLVQVRDGWSDDRKLLGNLGIA